MAEGEEKKLVLRAARRALREAIPARVAVLEAAAPDQLHLTDRHEIIWDNTVIARLGPGRNALNPLITVRGSEFLDGPHRERIRARLQAWLDAATEADLLPLLNATRRADANAALRGPLHTLSEALGLVPGATEERIAPDLRQELKKIGVRAGRFALFIPDLLKPRAVARRARLWAIQHRLPLPWLPPPGAIAIPPRSDWPDNFAATIGWVQTGPVLLRLDIAERLAAELAHATRRAAAAMPANLATRLGVPAPAVPAALRALGFRVIPAATPGPEEIGPPAPAMLVPLRRKKPTVEAQPAPPPPAHGPFAALAALAALRRG
jgi:ATP-dependent RNA helicase SUPV3L1/SUV3